MRRASGDHTSEKTGHRCKDQRVKGMYLVLFSFFPVSTGSSTRENHVCTFGRHVSFTDVPFIMVFYVENAFWVKVKFLAAILPKCAKYVVSRA